MTWDSSFKNEFLGHGWPRINSLNPKNIFLPAKHQRTFVSGVQTGQLRAIPGELTQRRLPTEVGKIIRKTSIITLTTAIILNSK